VQREASSHDCFIGQVLDCHLLESKEIKANEQMLHSEGITFPARFWF